MSDHFKYEKSCFDTEVDLGIKKLSFMPLRDVISELFYTLKIWSEGTPPPTGHLAVFERCIDERLEKLEGNI